MLGIGVGAAVVGTLVAEPLGLSGVVGMAHAISFRLLLGLGLVVVGVLVLIAGRRRASPWSLMVVAVLLVGGFVHVGVVVGPQNSADPARTAKDVVVVALNTQAGATAPDDVATLVADVEADVVALPETGAAAAEAVVRRLDGVGRTFQRFTFQAGEGEERATTLLVSSDLGRYREAVEIPTLSLGAAAAEPVDGDGPRLVALHTSPPLPLVFGMDVWRRDVRSAAGACPRAGDIVAGDFNATLDHEMMSLRDPCLDAAAGSGAEWAGTWPALLPSWLASPIDHVVVDARRWVPLGTDVIRAGGSDHRALVTHLRPAD